MEAWGEWELQGSNNSCSSKVVQCLLNTISITSSSQWVEELEVQGG